MTGSNRFHLLLATWFGAGFIPLAPGTWGSLFGLPIPWLFCRLDPTTTVCLLALFVLIAVWVSGKAGTILHNSDPSQVVIDEVVGLTVALLGFHCTPALFVCGFVLFRFFDILKPFPIRHIERRFKGGVGIVADDVAAGVFANICLRMLILLFPGLGAS